MTDLQKHAARCGQPTTWFVHVVACSRCHRIYDKYGGYELSKVDGDLCPSPNPAQRVYRDEADNVIQVGNAKTDRLPADPILASVDRMVVQAKLDRRYRLWRRLASWWRRLWMTRSERAMLTAMRSMFQNSAEVAEQYRQGQMGRGVGFDWFASDRPEPKDPQ